MEKKGVIERDLGAMVYSLDVKKVVYILKCTNYVIKNKIKIDRVYQIQPHV